MNSSDHSLWQSVLESKLKDPVYRLEGVNDVWNDFGRISTLIKQLTLRSLSLRYRDSCLGFLWSLLNPVLLMGVYTFIFHFVFQTNPAGVPYPVFFLTGLLAWNCFSAGAMSAAVSLIEGSGLIKRNGFPRITLPLSAVLSSGVNYVMSFPVLLIFGFALGVSPGLSLFLYPVALILLLALASGTGLLLATLIPRFRDLQHLAEVVFVNWFLLTPVLYPMAEIEARLSDRTMVLYSMNPMVGVMQLVHAAFSAAPSTWAT
jgi:ABC-2 type transport system permease protein